MTTITHDGIIAIMMAKVEILNKFLLRKSFFKKLKEKYRYFLKIGAAVPEKLGAHSPNFYRF